MRSLVITPVIIQMVWSGLLKELQCLWLGKFWCGIADETS